MIRALLTLRNFFLPVCLFPLFAISASGCGPAWTVVKQANPSPLVGQKSFAVEKLSFEGLKVGQKTEDAYLAGKEPQSQQSWAADKETMAQKFMDELKKVAKDLQIAPAAGGEPFTIRAKITFIEPGTFTGVFNMNTVVNLNVQILKGADVVDEITASTQVAATMYNPSVGGRLGSAAVQLAGITYKYLQSRIGAK